MNTMHQVLFRLATVIACAAILCMSANLAQARDIVAKTDIEIHPIYVEPGTSLTVVFESPLIQYDYPKKWKLAPGRVMNMITLDVPRGIALEDIPATIRVVLRHHATHLEIRAASLFNKKADDAVTIKHADQIAITEAGIQARAELLAAAMIEENQERHREVVTNLKEKVKVRDQKIETLERDTKRYGERVMVRTMHHGLESQPIKMGACKGNGVVICALRWRKSDENGLLRIAIDNRSPADATITAVQLFSKYSQEDHAGEVFIEGDEDWSEPNLEVTIPANTRVEASVAVKNLKSLGDAVRLVLSGPSSVLPASEWIDLQPPAEPEREMSLSLSASYGAAWLADGMGLNELDATVLRLASVRVTVAFTELIHVEGQLAIARSGAARFDDVSFNNMSGNLEHIATLGRAQIGGLLRWGGKVQPALRAGVGFQGAGYDSSFIVGGSTMSGPETSFEVVMFFGVGAGVDIRLSDNFVLGVELAGQSPLGTSDGDLFGRAVQAGASIGYTFTR